LVEDGLVVGEEAGLEDGDGLDVKLKIAGALVWSTAKEGGLSLDVYVFLQTSLARTRNTYPSIQACAVLFSGYTEALGEAIVQRGNCELPLF
jgi:hypothetical protein